MWSVYVSSDFLLNNTPRGPSSVRTRLSAREHRNKNDAQSHTCGSTPTLAPRTSPRSSHRLSHTLQPNHPKTDSRPHLSNAHSNSLTRSLQTRHNTQHAKTHTTHTHAIGRACARLLVKTSSIRAQR